MAKNRKLINVKGGGKLYVREIDPTPSNIYLDLGYIASTEFIDEHMMVGEPDETGSVIDVKSGGQKVTMKAILKQSSIEEINFLKNSNGKYFEFYYRNSNLANGNTQELSLPLCRVKAGFNLKGASASERQLDLEINVLIPKANFTRGVPAFNVTENVPYIITETSTAQFNLNNTEASDLATAII